MVVDQTHRARTRRIKYASKKLKDAQVRWARAERSVTYWTRVLNDLKYEATQAVQLPLIAEHGA